MSLASMGRIFSFLLHGLGILSFTSSFEYVFSRPNKISQGFGGHFQYLTNIGLLLSTLTFTFGVLDDIIHSVVSHRLRRTTRFIAMPLEATITICYWLAYFLNGSLLMDQRASPPMPFWRDVGFHLLPTLLLLADYYVLPPKKTLQMRSDLALIAYGGFLVLYGIWLVTCYHRNGYWPYPLLEKIGQEIKAILFVAVMAIMCEARLIVLKYSVKRA